MGTMWIDVRFTDPYGTRGLFLTADTVTSRHGRQARNPSRDINVTAESASADTSNKQKQNLKSGINSKYKMRKISRMVKAISSSIRDA